MLEYQKLVVSDTTRSGGAIQELLAVLWIGYLLLIV